jgi:hypothetical protein
MSDPVPQTISGTTSNVGNIWYRMPFECAKAPAQTRPMRLRSRTALSAFQLY